MDAQAEANALPLGACLLGIQRTALDEALTARRSTLQSSAAAAGRAPEDLWRQAVMPRICPSPSTPGSWDWRGSRQLPPCAAGEGPLTALICLQRLATRYRFPFPRDTVEQVCSTASNAWRHLPTAPTRCWRAWARKRPLSAPARQPLPATPPRGTRRPLPLVEDAGPKGPVVGTQPRPGASAPLNRRRSARRIPADAGAASRIRRG